MKAILTILMLVLGFSCPVAAQKVTTVKVRATSKPKPEAALKTPEGAKEKVPESSRPQDEAGGEEEESGLDQPEVRRNEPVNPSSSRELRAVKPLTGLFQLSTASLLIPFRPGISVGWNQSPEWTLELGYMSGSLSAGVAGQDLASFTESSVQLNARYFGSSNSFHYLLGVSRESGHFRLGNKYMSWVSGVGDVNLAQYAAVAINLGLGSRWQWKNGLSLGVDWATLIFPVSTLQSDSDYFQSNAPEGDKQSLRDALNIIARFPRVAFLTLSLGWSF